MMKNKQQLFIFFSGYIALSTALYFGSPMVSPTAQTVLLGAYFILLGLIGIIAKFFFFKVPFLADLVSIENSYRILNSVLIVIGLVFIANYWLKMFS